jgi:hypothetical protein
MNDFDRLPDFLKDRIDDYFSGLLDEARVRELEEHLGADELALRYFARYARLHTDLHLEVRSHQLSARVLEQIREPVPDRSPSRHLLSRSRLVLGLLTTAAALLIAVGIAWRLSSERSTPPESLADQAIAWLVNAQNCRWADGVEPAGNMLAGKVLKIERGLAEVRFQCGARVVLEGPASLELLSGRSARLMRGKLSARAPASVAGFEIVSPQGKVIDLGTEFGVEVLDTGATEVYVFEGKVEAFATDQGAAGGVSLTQNQGARITGGQVTVQPAGPGAAPEQFVREIVPPPVIVPRTLQLTFHRAAEGTLLDAQGLGTGLTHRLPGTGTRLPPRDPNLRLDLERQQLELTTTNSDLNTQYRLSHGEYLGVRLSDVGFTGTEDFAVTVTIPNIPALEVVGQFGLYAGTASDRNIRGGLIAKGGEPGKYTQFLVNNGDGDDHDISLVGLLSTGTDLRLTLRRTGGKYALSVENLTSGSSSTVTIPHPDFLDGQRDLFVGLFGANTQSEVRKTLVVKEFAVTVWTTSPAPGQPK